MRSTGSSASLHINIYRCFRPFVCHLFPGTLSSLGLNFFGFLRLLRPRLPTRGLQRTHGLQRTAMRRRLRGSMSALRARLPTCCGCCLFASLYESVFVVSVALLRLLLSYVNDLVQLCSARLGLARRADRTLRVKLSHHISTFNQVYELTEQRSNSDQRAGGLTTHIYVQRVNGLTKQSNVDYQRVNGLRSRVATLGSRSNAVILINGPTGLQHICTFNMSTGSHSSAIVMKNGSTGLQHTAHSTG